MVKKLFKHEIASYTRLMVPLYIVLLGVALLARVVQFFETDSVVYYLIFVPSIIMVVIAIFTAAILTTWTIILRFYRHLFSGEGYLTLTLPVSPTQHILVKMLTGVLFEVLTAIVSILSIVVLLAGDMLAEITDAVGYLLPFATEKIGAHLPLYIIEVIVMLFVSMASSILLYYACIAIGQTFSKNRALGALCVYLGYSMVMGIVSTILQAVVTPFAEGIMEIVINNATVAAHVSFLGSLTLSVILGVVYFCIVRFVMTKKLNLE